MIRQVREGDIRFIVVRPHAMDASPCGSSIIRKIYATATSDLPQLHLTEQLCATTIVTLKSLKYAGETPHGENPSRP